MKSSIKHPAANSAIKLTTTLFSVFLALVFLTSTSHAQISGSDLKRFQYEFSAQVYKQYADAVVYVTGEFVDPRKKEIKEFFTLPDQKSTDSIGTGFFITDTGYVLTNAHGVHKSVSAVVELRNSVRYNAQVVGFMLDSDLALLKIEPKEPVKAVEFKEDAEIEVGEPITSIGHPHGLKYTCTQGIISAVGRRSLLSDINVTVDNLLQTDMSINPGSSGGPWFNVEGKVVALTTSRRGGSDNIAFGVSAQKILKKLPALFDFPHRSGFVRGFDFSLKDGGVFVDNLDGESSAAKAGLKNGDKILSVNGTPITGIVSYLNLEEKFQPEQSVELTVKNENEQNKDNPDNSERTVSFTLEKWNAPDVNDALWSKVGLKVRELTEEEFKNCELKSRYAFVITEINNDRFNHLQYKIQTGDIIGKIAGVRPENLSELNRLLARFKSGDKINITILRALNAADKTPLISVSASHDSQQSETSENSSNPDADNKSENPDDSKTQKPKSISKTRIDITEFKIK
ncbi:MAG: trypsin-like peptidase domain-containing protein [Thermoguttaceae bacterium]|nr:trypsin-like peptidase domain-containing protein [Thermoguttaceae bacterium]